jgi:two-component system LytT family response regulator
MPYTTILIDDEQDCLSLLKWQLETYCPDMKIIAACNAAEEGLRAIEKMQPDVVFLDIEMPFINGFELLRRIPEINFEVVFTTAYDEYALKALKINALDYLLKPIAKDDLISAVEKLKKRVKSKSKGDDQPLLLQLLNLQNYPSKKIAIPIQDSILFLNIDDILYIKSESNYSTIQLKNSKSILASKTLRHFEDLLNGYQFYRIHASYLINLAEITKYKKTEGGSIVMSNGEEIKISRGRKDDFLKLL